MPRSKTLVVCAMCPAIFHPWPRKRVHPPTCSYRCARRQSSVRGQPLAAAIAGRKRHARQRLEATLGHEFGALTEREARIFTRAFQAGYDRGYPQSWRKRKDTAA